MSFQSYEPFRWIQNGSQFLNSFFKLQIYISIHIINPMEKQSSPSISSRKDEHILLCLEKDVQYKGITNGFDEIKLFPSILTNYTPNEINLSANFLKKEVALPIIVSGMTGGSNNGKVFNESIARICSEFKIGMGVGSQRAAIENSELINTYEVRHIAPNIPLIANLGIAQLAHRQAYDNAIKAVEMINADALAIHINPLQEIIQTEGDRVQINIVEIIEELKKNFELPIIIKGVGTGLSKEDAKILTELDIYAIDIAGAGGTNWSKIEYYRNKDVQFLSEKFLNWGISTKTSLINTVAHAQQNNVKVIASGGIWCGLDAVKALLLGADYVALALPILRAIGKGGIEECRNFLSNYVLEMRSVMTMLNIKDLNELKKERHKILDKI